MSAASEFLRKAFAEGDDKRDAGLTTPEDMERYDDLLYGEDPVRQTLDVYRPKHAGGEILPVIVSVHGGGWVYGDKERYQYYCMDLAQRGFAVVNFTYRLAPEFKYPANLEDTNLVMGWLLEHASDYGLDMEHIFAVGDSAGAQILASYAAICTNPQYAGTFPFHVPEGLNLRAIVLNCGVYRLDELSLLDPLTGGLRGDQMPEGGTEAEFVKASPVNFITGAFPPTLHMTCTGDILKQQAPVLEEKLLEQDVPHEFHYFGSPQQQLGHVFHLNIRTQAAKECNDMECAFFQRLC